MRSAVLSYLHGLSGLRPMFFWLTWPVITVVAAIFTAWIFRNPVNAPLHRDKPLRWSRRTAVPVTMLALLLVGYAALILVQEDFAWSDNSQFTVFTLRGIDFPAPIWPQDGRFFPLGLQEFNAIRHLTRTVAGYHAFPIAEVLVTAFILLILDRRLSIARRAVLAALALFTPCILLSFMGLIYPERNILVLLASMALFVQLFEETHSAAWAVGAVVSAQVMLYLKEPVWVLLLSFAAARLILRSRSSTHAGRNFDLFRDRESRLDLCIAALSLLFLPYYAIMMFPYAGHAYLDKFGVSRQDAVRYFIKSDPLAWVFAAAAATRMYRILRGRAAPVLLWDGLACGGVAYLCAYLVLGMISTYYLGPVDLIAVLYLGHLLLSSWAGMRPGVRIAAAALTGILVCQTLELSVFRALERKYVIHEKVAIANMLLKTGRGDPRPMRPLYFPFSGGYKLSEFAAYLRYRGLPMEEFDSGLKGDARVEIFGGRTAGVGPCFWNRSFVCHPRGAVEAGSLVVVLPDDAVPRGQMQAYRQAQVELRLYDPHAHTPELLVRLLGFLRSWN